MTSRLKELESPTLCIGLLEYFQHHWIGIIGQVPRFKGSRFLSSFRYSCSRSDFGFGSIYKL